MASVKAAFSNVLAELTLGQDIQPALNGLADTVTSFLFGKSVPGGWEYPQGVAVSHWNFYNQRRSADQRGHWAGTWKYFP